MAGMTPKPSSKLKARWAVCIKDFVGVSSAEGQQRYANRLTVVKFRVTADNCIRAMVPIRDGGKGHYYFTMEHRDRYTVNENNNEIGRDRRFWDYFQEIPNETETG
jgi:hypothetical protein